MAKKQNIKRKELIFAWIVWIIMFLLFYYKIAEIIVKENYKCPAITKCIIESWNIVSL